MNEINLGIGFTMPLSAATRTFAVLAKRGAGKTYSAAVLAEEFHRNRVPFVVIDPIDVWWGLRFAKNGKDKGLPVVVFGLQHADVKLDKDMGREIARAVVQENVSCVISTFGMPKTQQRHLLAEFSEELLNLNNTPRHVFIEEAHEFLPQKVFGGAGVAFNAVSNLVVMGRNRGIGVTLINQRAATLNKDVLTQIDVLIALRSVGPQDRKSLQEWVAYHGIGEESPMFAEFLNTLPSLPTGVAYVWSPEFLDCFQKVKIRERETFHPDREKLGENFQMPELRSVDVDAFVQRFNAQTAVKASKRLKIPISLPKGVIASVREVGPLGSKTFDAAIYSNGEYRALEPQVNVQVIRNEYETKLMHKDIEIRNLKAVIDRARSALGGPVARQALGQSTEAYPGSANSDAVGMWAGKLGDSTMPGRLFKFLVEKHPMKFSRPQLAFQCGYSASGGSFRNALSTLRVNRLIKEEGDMVAFNSELA